MDQKELLRLLKPLRRKRNKEQWMLFLSQGLLVGLGCGVLLRAAGKVWVISEEWVWTMLLLALGVASAAVRRWKNQESWLETAKAADGLGLSERMITAYELLGKEERSPLEKAAVEDALETAKKTDWKQYRFHWPKREWKFLLVLLAVFFLLGFVKNPNRAYPLETVQTEVTQAEKEAEQSKEKELLSSAAQKDLEKTLSAMKKELKQSKTVEEGIRTLEETQAELKELEKQESKDFSALKEALSSQEAMAQMAQAVAQKNTTSLSAAMEAFAESLSSMSEEELAALAKALEEAAEQAEESQLKEALSQAASQVAQGSLSVGTLSSLNQAMAQAIQQATKAQASISAVNQQLKNAAQKLQGQSGNGQNGTGGEGSGSGEGQGEGNGSGAGGGTGQGGQGSGSGGQGRGFGNGEVFGEENAEAANKEGYETQLQGTDTLSGTSQTVSAQIIGQDGKQVPLEEVLGDYSQAQLNRLEESNVPYGLKEMVETYFSTLEQ